MKYGNFRAEEAFEMDEELRMGFWIILTEMETDHVFNFRTMKFEKKQGR